MDNLGKEKRRFVRIEEGVCAWLQFRQEGAAYGTLTVDLGSEGARFSTLRQVNVGEMLLVCLQLPTASLECKGRICWVSPEVGGQLHFGVRFLDLREVEQEHITRHISERIAAQVVVSEV